MLLAHTGGCADPVGVATITYLCGIEECVKSSSEMFQVTYQSLLSDSKFRWVSEKLFCFYFVCTTSVYIHIYRFAAFIQLVYAILYSQHPTLFGCTIYILCFCTSNCNYPTKRTHLFVSRKKSPCPCRSSLAGRIQKIKVWDQARKSCGDLFS